MFWVLPVWLATQRRFRRARGGGALYLETPRPGHPWVSPRLRELLRDRDYDDADFERMRFGRAFTVDGTVFREVLALNLAR